MLSPCHGYVGRVGRIGGVGVGVGVGVGNTETCRRGRRRRGRRHRYSSMAFFVYVNPAGSLGCMIAVIQRHFFGGLTVGTLTRDRLPDMPPDSLRFLLPAHGSRNPSNFLILAAEKESIFHIQRMP